MSRSDPTDTPEYDKSGPKVRGTISDWDAVLPHARRRLAAKAAELRCFEPSPSNQRASSKSHIAAVVAADAQSNDVLSKDGLASSVDAHERGGVGRSGVVGSGGVKVIERADNAHVTHDLVRPIAKRSTGTKIDGKESSIDESLDQKARAKARHPSAAAIELARSFEEPNAAKETTRKWFAKMSGVVASAVAHILLLVLLAFFTLKMPSPPAGMEFDSASVDTVEEAVELTQPLETTSPDASESSENVETNLDFSDQLSDISTQPVDDALGSMAPPGESVSSAVLAAMSSSMPSMSDATFFGASAGGNNFCYVIDGSGSMRGGPWEAARAELLKSLASLKPKQRFYIIIFKREFEPITMPGEREPAPSALYATKENLEHARRWLLGVKIGQSGGPPKESVKFAIEKEPDAIYLLTDGVTQSKNVAEVIREANLITDLINGEQVRCPIHTIAYYSLDGQELLKQIAQENKGQFIYVPDPAKR